MSLVEHILIFVLALSRYRVVSLEKCTGVRSNQTTEDAIYATAQQIKRIDSSIKVGAVFMHSTHSHFPYELENAHVC